MDPVTNTHSQQDLRYLSRLKIRLCRGLDLLFEGQTHRIKKIILHTNAPDHASFGVYNKCHFTLAVGDKPAQPLLAPATSISSSVNAASQVGLQSFTLLFMQQSFNSFAVWCCKWLNAVGRPTSCMQQCPAQSDDLCLATGACVMYHICHSFSQAMQHCKEAAQSKCMLAVTSLTLGSPVLSPALRHHSKLQASSAMSAAAASWQPGCKLEPRLASAS